MLTKELPQKLLAEICQRNDAHFLALFGSTVRGEATKESDIDLLVRFSKRKSLLQIVRIEREFSELLGQKVDLVTDAALSPYLKETVYSEMEILYEEAQ